MKQHDNIEKLFEDTPYAFYSKIKAGDYINVNQAFLSDYDMTSLNDVVGKKDIDLWNGQAPLFHINDRKVVASNRTGTYIEDILFQNEKRFYLSVKSPLILRSGKVVGIFGVSFLLNSKNPIEYSSLPENLIETLQFLQYGYLKNNNIFIHAKLTARQQECLQFLARGMSVKQIATTLKLSPKTIENYLAIIKVKLNCVTRYQLIEKAFSLGLF